MFARWAAKTPSRNIWTALENKRRHRTTRICGCDHKTKACSSELGLRMIMKISFNLKNWWKKMFVRLSVPPPDCLSIRPLVCPSVRLSVHPIMCPLARPSVQLSVGLSVRLSAHLSLSDNPSVCASVRLSLRSSIRPILCPSVCPSIPLSAR